MADSKKSAVFDIHPGRTPASATSRQIILKNSTVSDPMVVEKPDGEAAGAPPLTPPSGKKLVIQPLHDDIGTASMKPQPVEPTDEASTNEEVPKRDNPETIADLPVNDEAKAKPSSEEISTDNNVPAAPQKTVKDIPDEPIDDDAQQALERELKVQRMVESEEYFLPIETSEQRRSRTVVVFGIVLILVLALAWLDVAIDAGIISNTLNLPHTSLFRV